MPHNMYVLNVGMLCSNLYLSKESILPDPKQHHVRLVSVGQTGEEIFLSVRRDLDGVGNHTGCLLFGDGGDLFTWNGKLQYQTPSVIYIKETIKHKYFQIL